MQKYLKNFPRIVRKLPRFCLVYNIILLNLALLTYATC